MTADEYGAFTDLLCDGLAADDRVLGLVALGSMAAIDYRPDAWSDHDFFVVTRPGEQEAMREDLSWLPRAGRIVFSFRETEHGVKTLYDDGHLLEFAVFDDAELSLAKVNRYRVLFDRSNVEARMAEVRTATVRSNEGTAKDDTWLVGQFVTNLLVGTGRYHRGERMSGHLYVKSHALGHLLVLLARHVPAERAGLLDDLDPSRRFDLVYPEIGMELDALLRVDVPEAAARMIALARRELGDRAASLPTAVDAVDRFIRLPAG